MTKRGTSRWIYLVSALGLALVAWVVLDGERHLFSTAPTPVSVEVRAVLLPRDDNGGTPYYLYIVTLPDGAVANYNSERVYRPGDRIAVLYSRGKLTGRIRLTTPAADAER